MWEVSRKRTLQGASASPRHMSLISLRVYCYLFQLICQLRPALGHAPFRPHGTHRCAGVQGIRCLHLALLIAQSETRERDIEREEGSPSFRPSEISDNCANWKAPIRPKWRKLERVGGAFGAKRIFRKSNRMKSFWPKGVTWIVCGIRN